MKQALLRDDFDGSALDQGNWYVPTGPGTFFGRTQIRPPSQLLEVANGVVRLQIDTYNPTARIPGDSFWGSEIVTRQVFARGNGVAFRARVRVVGPVAGGMVASLFSYHLKPSAVRDELDFELLTNDIAQNRNRVLTNIFKDDGFNVPGRPIFVPVLNFEFNEFEVRWLPGRVQWYVNGGCVREEAVDIEEPMDVRLNFWAPAADFTDAFDASLQPARSPAENRTFFYEVDFVEVDALVPLPAGVPPTSTGFGSTRVDPQGIRLFWSATPSADSYRLFVTGPGVLYNQNVGNTTVVQGVNLQAGNYNAQLFGVNQTGESATPAAQNFTIGGCVLPGQVVPPGQNPFNIIKQGSNVTVSWPAAPNATQHVLEVITELGVLLALPTNATMLFAPNAPNGIYLLRVFGRNVCGDGPRTNPNVPVTVP